MRLPILSAGVATSMVAVLCIAGGLSPLLPWSTGGAGYYVVGFGMWYGGTFAGAFLLLLLYEVMTSAVRPRPVWQPLVTFFGAAALLALFTHYGYSLGHRWVHTAGPWVCVAAVVSLLLVSALQVRRVVASRAGTDGP